MVTQRKTSGPDWRSPEWLNEHVPCWEKVNDVYKSLNTKALKSKYLRHPIGEEDKSYDTRVELASMGHDLKEAVQSNAGLMAMFDTEEETPESLMESLSNVDKQGNSLNQYLVKAAASAFKNECVLLGVHIETKEGKTGDRLPYFSCISIPEQVYAPHTEYIDGEKCLSRVSIRSDEFFKADEGFELKQRETYWVYELKGLENGKKVATLQKYERANKENNGGELEAVDEPKILTNARNEPLTRLPFVWLGIDPDSSVGEPGLPPFYSMAEKMIRLFNLESELDAIQRKVNIPVPTYEHMGAVPEKPEDVILGPDSVIHHAKDTKPGFAEPSGAAMTISEQRIQTLKEEIGQEREKFLSTTQTATASLLNAGQEQMSVQTIAHAIESAFEELFKLWALLSDRTYVEGTKAGGIKISLKFLKPSVNYQDVMTLQPMYELGVFQDAYDIQAKALDMGYITKEMLEEAEKMRENASERPLRINLEQAAQNNGKNVVLG